MPTSQLQTQTTLCAVEVPSATLFFSYVPSSNLYNSSASAANGISTDVRCKVTCPSCGNKFTIARKYETHLPSCLEKQTVDNKKDLARKKRKRLHRLSLNELELARTRKSEGLYGTGAISIECEVDHDGIADPELIGEPEGNMNAATGLHIPNPQPFQPAPNNCIEACHVQSPTMGRNDVFEFPTTYTANNSPLAHRYARGPLLLDNPMEWSVSLTAQPMFMTAQDAGASALYPQPGMGCQGSGQVGDGNLGTLYEASFVNAVGVT